MAQTLYPGPFCRCIEENIKMTYRNYHRKKHQNDSATTIRVVCAIVFVSFSWCWLYFFQSDLLAMAQHVLSGGLTHYNRFLGALVITIVLVLLQRLIHKLTLLGKSFYAFTYFPSLLLLGMITNFVTDGEGGIMHDVSGWVAILLLLIWGGVVYVSKQLQELDEDRDTSIFSRSMWVNQLFMVLLMMTTVAIGNTNAVFHYRMRAEHSLLDGDFERALAAGRKSLECDEHLVMLRMHALARQGELGERLFEYKVCGTSKSILPTDGHAALMLYPADSIFQYIGVVPAHKMTPMHYLKLAQHHLQLKDSLPHQVVNDYLLSGYLIDKDIDAFAREVGKHYALNDSLPKHYREAMVLYTHLRARPVAVYQNAVLDEDYDNFRELRRQYTDKMEQKGKVADLYFGTYWYYYWYE